MNIKAIHKDLTFRYLLWAYKSTRESFERIERKTTQLRVDRKLLDHLKQTATPKAGQDKQYDKLMADFVQYIESKSQDEITQKYTSPSKQSLNAQYLYLKNRLTAIEKAIVFFLGSAQLKKIQKLFEEEFIQRILSSRDH